MSAKIFCLSSNFYCLLDLLASKAFIVFILEGFYTKEVFHGGTEKNYYILW
jgi:hypothetical protein